MSRNVKFYFKQFDLISQRPTLLINNSERIRSVYGAILTIVLVVVTVIFSIYFLQELFGRSNPRVLYYQVLDTPDDEVNLDYHTFPLFFSIQKDGNDKINFNKYFKMEVVLFNLTGIQSKNSSDDRSEYEKFKLNYASCKNLNSLIAKAENFFCITKGDTDLILKTRNDASRLNTFLSFSLKLCQNTNDKCVIPDQTIKNSLKSGEFVFLFGYYDTTLDINNISRPSPPIPNPQYLKQKISESFKYQLDYRVSRGKYSTDFGYIFTDIDDYDYLTIDKDYTLNIENRLNGNLTDPELLSFTVSINNLYKNVYVRSFYKGHIFFAEVGGVFNFLYLIAYHLNLLYSIINFYLAIDNHCGLSYFAEKEISARKSLGNFKSLHYRHSIVKEESGVQNAQSPLKNNNPIGRLSKFNKARNLTENNGEVLFLNQIGFRKLYSSDLIDSVVSDFKIKVRNMNQNSISKTTEMMFRIICCDRQSKKRKVYSRTMKKIREYLDVNNFIKLQIEFDFIKNILFSKNILELIKCFTNIKSIKEDKVGEIHVNIREIYEHLNNPDSINNHNNNAMLTEDKVKDMDHYAAQYFIETFMK